MSKFHTLTVSEVRRETPDAVSVEFEVPESVSTEFAYTQGQYLTLKFNLNGEELRRSYSLCSSPLINEKLRVAVKEVENGKVSVFMNRNLKAGDKVECMPPMGAFFTPLSPNNKKHYVGIAAGSGITPLFSILRTVLLAEPESRFTLIYANKTKDTSIFGALLTELEKTSGGRLKLLNVYSRQDADHALLKGRLDKTKVSSILKEFSLLKADEFFICGPEEMIMNATGALSESGIAKENIHYELFTTPVLLTEGGSTGDDTSFSGDASVKVIIDGIETEFTLNADGKDILDAAIDAGADAPFSCKGAVCCTCKGKVIEGKAHMEMNYALTDKEVADGYILTCQAHPRSSKVVVDYDVA